MTDTTARTSPDTVVEPPRRSGRTHLIIMLVIAAVSLFGSYSLFLTTRDGSPWGTTNNGAFVTPPLTLAELEIPTTERPIATGEFWWLLTVVPAACETSCEETLHLLRQMHILLNKDSDRAVRGLLAAEAPAPALLERYPALAFGRSAAKDLEAGVYIVDPLGNFVFKYPLEVDGSAMLKDLKRLLKVSQIG